MDFPTDLRYTKNDEWVRVDGDSAVIGITDYAQDQLSDIVYVEVNPGEGDSVSKGDSFGTVESVKAAADVYMPISGTVTAINDLLEDTPEVINDDPYGQAWMLKITISDAAELDGLLDPEAYQAFRSE
jgi:glycine cleavage system H protein